VVRRQKDRRQKEGWEIFLPPIFLPAQNSNGLDSWFPNPKPQIPLAFSLPLPTFPPMNSKEQEAYNKALAKIEAYRKSGEKSLSLGAMNLTQLPPEIGQLTALTELLLFDNQLTSLPPEIGQLSALLELSLWDNQLKSLPPLPARLESLYIEGNPLESLDSHLFDVVNQDCLPPKLMPLMLEHRARQEGEARNGG
jgi:Leucine-rich repeat (LRR) protein